MKKKICVVTGNRAEYGLLKKLLNKLKADENINLQIVATGSHLSKEFGYTFKEIIKDGFKINSKIHILSNSDKPVDICKSIGKGVFEFSKLFSKMNPDIVVLLGDRYELFSAATACLVNQCPIAHIHGGEVTLGAIDDSIRHSITKMSHIHFVSTNSHKKRVLQLGENPKFVFQVGGFGHDAISTFKFYKKKDVEKKLGFEFKKKNIIFTFHPITLDKNKSKEQILILLECLSQFRDIFFIFTMANADTYGKVINKEIKKFVKKNSNSIFYKSLGQQLYYNCLKHVDAMIGNSSSGILEAPSFNLPAINIGDRQQGRDQGTNVINVDINRKEIVNAIKNIYKNREKVFKSPYIKKNASLNTYKVLKQITFKNTKKIFFDY